MAKVAELRNMIPAGKRLHGIIKASTSPLAETLDGMPADQGTVPEHKTANELPKLILIRNP